MTTDDLRTRAREAAEESYPRAIEGTRTTRSIGVALREGYIEGFLDHAAQQPTREVYSVQYWEDGDGIRAGWVTGYGGFTHSRSDAEAQLAHDRRRHPTEHLRLAVAEITYWRGVPTNGAGS